MSDLYKTAEVVTESPQVAEPQVEKERIASTETSQEVPYTDYEKTSGHPYLVDYFELGDTWRDKLGGFEKEITLIDGYFKEQIEQGQLRNELAAVKEKMKKIYKLCNIDTTERITMQIEKLAAYIEFLRKTENINLNHFKYGI